MSDEVQTPLAAQWIEIVGCSICISVYGFSLNTKRLDIYRQKIFNMGEKPKPAATYLFATVALMYICISEDLFEYPTL